MRALHVTSFRAVGSSPSTSPSLDASAPTQSSTPIPSVSSTDSQSPNAGLSRLMSFLRSDAAKQTPKPASSATQPPIAEILESFPHKYMVSAEEKALGQRLRKGQTTSLWRPSTPQEAPLFSDSADKDDLFGVVDNSVLEDAASVQSGRPTRSSSPRSRRRTEEESGALDFPTFEQPPKKSKPRRLTTPSSSETEPWPPKIPDEPFKLLVLNVPSATDADVRLGFQNLELEKDVHIKRIEFYTEPRGRGARATHAFVSLATEEDYNILMSDTVRPFGVYINSQRCGFAPCQDRRIVYIRGLKADDEAEVRKILADMSIDLTAVDRVEMGESESGAFSGSCNVHFKSHAEAYKAIRYLNNLDGRAKFAPTEHTMSASWGRQGILQEMKKKKNDLDRENKSLKEQIARLSDEIKKIEHVETVADVRLANVLFKHVSKVLETTNFDKMQAAQLLDVTPSRLNRIIAELKREGLEIKDDRFAPRKIQMRKLNL